MPTIDLKLLVNRLNETSRRALEAAAGTTLSRTHYNVEIEHWLLQLLEHPRSDVELIARHFEIPVDRLSNELTAVLDRMTTGNGRAPSLSPDLVGLVKDAWLLASIEDGVRLIRSGHLISAALADSAISARLHEAAPHLRRIVPDILRRDLAKIVAGGAEAPAESEGGVSTSSDRPPASAGGGTALDRYTVDLTAQARAGRVDPILGRDSEIRQIIDILTRRRQNNPILTGEAGVGKTAVVEGLALRIAAGDVPQAIANVAIRTLDLGLLQAGAGIKGEFENRLRSVIEECQASPIPVILFVDEAHNLIGAGNGAGQGDAANLLKPPLARGELRMIAATTWAEYKKFFEKDAALTRRFQTVKVEEPSEDMAVAMVRGLLSTLEQHHGIHILDEAVEAAVKLSARFIPSRQLPDKAVSLIDTACARVAMSQASPSPAVEDVRRRIDLIATELRVLRRELLSGADHQARIAALEVESGQLDVRLQELQGRWNEERRLAQAIGETRARVEMSPEPAASQRDLAALTAELNTVQSEQPLVFPVVDAQAVAEIVESWTGIPAGRMRSDEIRTVLDLRQAMERRIIGQPHALEAIAQSVRTSRAGLTDPRKPIGVFLMVGTSGVGKTETALTLSELLYGGEQNLTVINMSEFKEEHKVSLLMGSPPGYVGYGEGGILTEAVRRRPYSVVLLDEMEKAHSSVHDIFFQAFDKGTMKDSEGRDIDFKNTIIIMTSNAGTDLISRLFADPETAPDAEGLAVALREELAKTFKPAFLGRVTVVPYLPLSQDTLRQVATLQLDRIATRVERKFGTSLRYSPELIDMIVTRCTDASAGARGIESLLTKTLLPDLSAQFLARMAEGKPAEQATVEIDDTGSFLSHLQ